MAGACAKKAGAMGRLRRWIAACCLLLSCTSAHALDPQRRIAQFHHTARTGQVAVTTDHGTEWFDHVVLASHSDQSLAMLAQPSPLEQQVLGAIRYQPNRAVLHTDAALLPRSPGLLRQPSLRLRAPRPASA